MPNLEQCGSGTPTEKMATLMGKLMIKQWIWGYQKFSEEIGSTSHDQQFVFCTWSQNSHSRSLQNRPWTMLWG